LNHNPACVLHSWVYRHEPAHLACLLRWGLANFLLRLALNCNPPYLCHPRSWDYRHELCHGFVVIQYTYHKIHLFCTIQWFLIKLQSWATSTMPDFNILSPVCYQSPVPSPRPCLDWLLLDTSQKWNNTRWDFCISFFCLK
jgi:hypothetical protein